MVKQLTPEQKDILLREGTEPPGSSPLNNEKREGDYLCAACGTKLFESKSKYESGSGWPSFFESLPDVFETKVDNIIRLPLEQNIIVKNVEVITVIFLMTDLNQLVKDIVIMDFMPNFCS